MVRKGYIRTIEAIIGIVLILIIVYTVIPKEEQKISKVPSVVEEAQEFITMAIGENDSIRDCIINNPQCMNSTRISAPISNNVPIGYAHVFEICEVTSCTTVTPLDRSIYVNDIFISGHAAERNPKLVRIWMWHK